MSILVRPATMDDQPVVAALLKASRLHTRSASIDGMHVAESDGRIVGTVQVTTLRDGTRELRGLAVDPAHRGTKIVRHLLKAAAEAGPGPMYGFCDESLERFYRYYGARAAWRGPSCPARSACATGPTA